MFYTRTRAGRALARKDWRAVKARHPSATFVLHRHADAFDVSVWDGMRYIGPLHAVPRR